MPKLETWYQTDLSFSATKERILKLHAHEGIIGDMRDNRGRLSFSLSDFKDVTFQITTKGKLGIYYPGSISAEECLPRVEHLLVRVDGGSARITCKIKEPSRADGISIVKVSINRSDVEMTGVRALTIELSLLNELKTSTIIEEVCIETDASSEVHRMKENIPGGETRQISPIPSSAAIFGKTWKEGGMVNFEVVHTYGATSLSLEVPPLDVKSLPYTLFQATHADSRTVDKRVEKTARTS